MHDDLYHWEFSIAGDPYSDGYFGCIEDARDAAYTHYAFDITENCDPMNGEVFSAPLELVLLRDDQEGNVHIEDSVEEVVEYEHYRGDLEEHGLTMGDVL